MLKDYFTFINKGFILILSFYYLEGPYSRQTKTARADKGNLYTNEKWEVYIKCP